MFRRNNYVPEFAAPPDPEVEKLDRKSAHYRFVGYGMTAVTASLVYIGWEGIQPTETKELYLAAAAKLGSIPAGIIALGSLVTGLQYSFDASYRQNNPPIE